MRIDLLKALKERNTRTFCCGPKTLGHSLHSNLLQLNPALRTPHHYGQFALFLGKESPYIFSKFILFNTDTSCSPSVYCAVLDLHCFKASVKSLDYGRYASVTNSINKAQLWLYCPSTILAGLCNILKKYFSKILYIYK